MFTDYYGEQSCTAGRATFVTGQSAFRVGLTKVGMPGAKSGISDKDPTMAELLKPQGYVSGQFGKNHLGDRNEYLPTVHGFDEYAGVLYHLNALEEPENVDYPKDTLCLQKDREELMAFFDFPAQHWQSLRTSNPIESTFGTIRHRTKRSKGCLSRDGMLHMMFKLGMCAEKNWRRQRGFNYLAKVITEVTFKDGIEVTKSDQAAA